MGSDVSDRYVNAPVVWPDASKLLARAGSGALLLLPEERRMENDTIVVPFRRFAQDLRVFARDRGRQAELVIPDGTRAAVYSEHAADWVLPVVFSVPATIAATLIAAWIEERLRGGKSVPVVRYREARLVGTEMKVREIEGPADKVRELLSDDNRSAQGQLDETQQPGTSHSAAEDDV